MPVSLLQPNYTRMRDAYALRVRPFVFWIGAGLSQPAGLPIWMKLKNDLYDQALETISTLKPDDAKVEETKLEQAHKAASLWDAFSIIKSVMGDEPYKSAIRQTFDGRQTVDVPYLYNIIWDLSFVYGALTLNIDGFTARGHRNSRQREDAPEFSGKDVGDYVHLIGARRTFIANLHGKTDSVSSWVFTREEISAQISNPSYRTFIQTIFSTMTVVFVGISADDSAAGGLLAQLKDTGVDPGPHYWITDRSDAKTGAWASASGINVIRYTTVDDEHGRPDHTSPLSEIFLGLKNAKVRETKQDPVLSPVDAITAIPSVAELKMRDEDEVRVILASYAKGIIKSSQNTSDNDAYKEFIKKYSPVIYQSWHITSDEPYNKFFGFEVLEEIASSPFSSVWKVKDESGTIYALKLLQIRNLTAGVQIDSFRRGIASLQFLSAAEVPGTAKFKSAQELPTSVVMDFVDGDNLSELAKASKFDFWTDGLAILINTCRHLEYGHNLPANVIHRDVRPSNIMVPNFYWDEHDAAEIQIDRHEAVLINYDMSWHVNARGQTIAGNIEEAGFYAPEQIEDASSERARSTLIDSYGVGMSIFYAYTGTMPPTGGSKSADWESILEKNFRPSHQLTWRSGVERLKRLIFDATRPDTDERLDFAKVYAELRIIQQAVRGEYNSLTADVWAEEVFNRSVILNYQFDGNNFFRELRVGRSISARGDLRSKRVLINFRNTGSEATNRSGVDRIWKEKLVAAKGVLKSSGWVVSEESRYSEREITLECSADVERVRVDMRKLVAALNRALDLVKLD